MKIFLLPIVSAFLLSACAVPITRSDLRTANYGTKPDNAKSTAAAYFQKVLIDPDSMKLACAEPKKGWARQMSSQPPNYGYVLYCEVNAKNRLGGYTGTKPQILLFQNGRLVVTYDEKDTIGFGEGETFGFAE